jgi:hypothetical protein
LVAPAPRPASFRAARETRIGIPISAFIDALERICKASSTHTEDFRVSKIAGGRRLPLRRRSRGGSQSPAGAGRYRSAALTTRCPSQGATEGLGAAGHDLRRAVSGEVPLWREGGRERRADPARPPPRAAPPPQPARPHLYQLLLRRPASPLRRTVKVSSGRSRRQRDPASARIR